jgi:hypothetical protein
MIKPAIKIDLTSWPESLAQLLGEPSQEICGVNTIQDAGQGGLFFLVKACGQAPIVPRRLDAADAVGLLDAQLIVGNVNKR